MKTRITATLFLSLLISACSNSPKIVSATDDKVVIQAKPESFLDAYDVAKRECDKNTRIAIYITDGIDDLNSVAFDCFDPNPEPEVVAEADADVTTETEPESVIEEEFVEEPEALAEEAPIETEEVIE